MSRRVFKGFTAANHFQMAELLLKSSVARENVPGAYRMMGEGECDGAISFTRAVANYYGQLEEHVALGEEASEKLPAGKRPNWTPVIAAKDALSADLQKLGEALDNKCLRGAPRAEKPAEAPPAPKAKKAKAPKRLQTRKTDWLAPPTLPGEPEPFPTEMEEAIEAIQEAEAEGPRITITPAREDDAPDVAARAKLDPREGWAEGQKRPRKARAAREVPDELPPLTPEALAPPRKRGPRGNTRTLEYTSKSGKVCRIKISSTPNGCLLVED